MTSLEESVKSILEPHTLTTGYKVYLGGTASNTEGSSHINRKSLGALPKFYSMSISDLTGGCA